MIRIICDRCGNVVSDTEMAGYISLLHRKGPDGTLEGENEFEECNFCGICMDQVRQFVRHSRRDTTEPARDPTEAEEPAQDLPEAEEPSPQAGQGRGKKGRNRSIDYGKIMALKEARWSSKRIAEEMGMTPGAVDAAVCNYRKGKACAGEQGG